MSIAVSGIFDIIVLHSLANISTPRSLKASQYITLKPSAEKAKLVNDIL